MNSDLEFMQAALVDLVEGSISETRRRRKNVLVIVCSLTLAASAFAVATSASAADAVRNVGSALISILNGDDGDAPADSRDQLQELQTAIDDDPATSERLGTQRLTGAKVLLTYESDGYSIDLAATTTSTDKLCYTARVGVPGWAVSGTDTCITGFDKGMPISGSGSMAAAKPTVVYGVTSDDVKQVRFVTANKTYDAVMGTNSYFWVAPSTREDAEFVEVVLKSGDVLRRKSDYADQRRRNYGE